MNGAELGTVEVVSVGQTSDYGHTDMVVRDRGGAEHLIRCGRHWPTAAGWPPVGAVLPLTWCIDWEAWAREPSQVATIADHAAAELAGES